MKIPDFENKEHFKIVFQEVINVANHNNSIRKNINKLNTEIYLVIRDMSIIVHLFFSINKNREDRFIALEWSQIVNKKAPVIIEFDSAFFNGFFQGKSKPLFEIMKGSVVIKGDQLLGIKTFNLFSNMKNEYKKILNEFGFGYLIVKP